MEQIIKDSLPTDWTVIVTDGNVNPSRSTIRRQLHRHFARELPPSSDSSKRKPLVISFLFSNGYIIQTRARRQKVERDQMMKDSIDRSKCSSINNNDQSIDVSNHGQLLSIGMFENEFVDNFSILNINPTIKSPTSSERSSWNVADAQSITKELHNPNTPSISFDTIENEDIRKKQINENRQTKSEVVTNDENDIDNEPEWILLMKQNHQVILHKFDTKVKRIQLEMKKMQLEMKKIFNEKKCQIKNLLTEKKNLTIQLDEELNEKIRQWKMNNPTNSQPKKRKKKRLINQQKRQ